jgi:hypothetical protein
MTILNIANDGYYSNFVAICRTVASAPSMPRDKLQELCGAGAESDLRTRQTLNRWIELGLLRDEDGMVGFADQALKNHTLPEITTALPAVVRRVVFTEENNDRFWESDKSRCADLVRGLSWLLAQDVYTVDTSSHSKASELERRQVADSSRRIVQNDVRWNGLRTWAVYLGFAWNGHSLIIDPTAAIRQDLPRIFEEQKELPATEFIDRLAGILPVLDFGRYRKEVEGSLDPSHWQRPSRPEMLSSALSRALWRLHLDNRLFVESRSDAVDGYTLQRQAGQEWTRFTHLRLLA